MATGEEAVRGEGAAQGSQGKQEQQATAMSIGDQRGKRGKWRWEKEGGGKGRGGEGGDWREGGQERGAKGGEKGGSWKREQG